METEQYVLWRSNDTSLSKEKVSSIYSDTVSSYPKVNEHGSGTLYTSYYSKPDDRLEMDLLSDEYVSIMEDICSHLSVSLDGFHFWTQIYDGGHDVHNHESKPSAVSFVHFIEPIGTFFYFVTSDGEKVYPKQEKGDIIAFHPAQNHGVDPSYGKERMVIAGNIHSYGN